MQPQLLKFMKALDQKVKRHATAIKVKVIEITGKSAVPKVGSSAAPEARQVFAGSILAAVDDKMNLMENPDDGMDVNGMSQDLTNEKMDTSDKHEETIGKRRAIVCWDHLQRKHRRGYIQIPMGVNLG